MKLPLKVISMQKPLKLPMIHIVEICSVCVKCFHRITLFQKIRAEAHSSRILLFYGIGA